MKIYPIYFKCLILIYKSTENKQEDMLAIYWFTQWHQANSKLWLMVYTTDLLEKKKILILQISFDWVIQGTISFALLSGSENFCHSFSNQSDI